MPQTNISGRNYRERRPARSRKQPVPPVPPREEEPLTGRRHNPPLDNRTRSRKIRLYRIRQILMDSLYRYPARPRPKETENADLEEVFARIETMLKSAFESAYSYFDCRPIKLFSDRLSSLFHQPLAKGFKLIEYGLPITDWNANRLNNINWIQKSIYIDSPMAINGSYRIAGGYWSELNSELRRREEGDGPGDFDEINDIISGEVVYHPSLIQAKGFRYRRDDGEDFDIEECATGIKAFGMLQLLLNNGSLTKNTLLIIDEPEAHLHPKWIVEYARVVVLLNKRLGVKFFIASHSPDMVSAIKYIAEKEQMEGGLNFYLAEKTHQGYQYDYTPLGTDIEKIFSSFNIAFERINQYGSKDEA